VFEFLTEGSALPNLHPALVHFPIALAGAALLFDLFSLVRRGEGRRSAVVLWWLAAAVGLAAYLAGESAEEGLGVLAPAVERAVGQHSDSAWWTLAGIGTAALLRSIALAGWGGRSLAWLGIVAGVGAQFLILRTADLGGALVYRHGVAVSKSVQTTAEADRPAPPAFVRGDDGSWSWTPATSGASSLGPIFEPSSAGSLQTRVLPGGPGLRLRVTGNGSLLLPGRFADLRLEADLDLARFDGTVGIGAFTAEPDDGVSFERGPEGGLALVRSRPAARDVLDEGGSESGAGRVQLVLSLVGGHWKGYVSGQSRVHAHGTLSGALRPRLILRGNGEIGLLSLRTTAIAGPPSHAGSH
jgi:uncharacterized membrane protein